MNTWLLLHYKLPTRPSALRVYIWRKLKRLGAILLNDAVWVLPDTPRTAEHFQWLAAEIQEMQGDVNLWNRISCWASRRKRSFSNSINRSILSTRVYCKTWSKLIQKYQRFHKDINKSWGKTISILK